MNKDKIERIFSSVGIKPESRQRWRNYEIFIADGLVDAKDFWKFKFKFGNTLNDEDFPNGAYVTVWFYTGPKFGGGIVGCPPLAAIEYDGSSRRAGRVDLAMRQAVGEIQKRERNEGIRFG